MIEIRNILCPIDFSEHSRHALDHAVALARWYGSTMTVLHVVDPVAAYAPALPGTAAVVVAPVDHGQLQSQVQSFVALSPDGPQMAVVTREGDTAREVLAQAAESGTDLLVLGTHGRSGFERLVLGSVTEKLLRRATCPVLSVPPRSPNRSPALPIVYKRILCPLDFSPSSMKALRYAMSLAQEADAELSVLHVMEYYTLESEVYETTFDERLTVAEYGKRCRALGRERLEAAVPDEVRTYCTVKTMLAEGKPYREILRIAAEQQDDLIVMGVRGRGAVDLLLFGSTTQHVVRQATCPVLTIRDE